MHIVKRLLSSAIWGSFCGSVVFGAPAIVAPSINVGNNLQAAGTISLSEAAAEGSLDVTLLSSNGDRVRFSKKQDQAGSASLVVRIGQGFRESPEFWVQGLGGTGVVSYTATARDVVSTGTVTITPSAIAIIGPMKGPKFFTTTRSTPTSIRLSAVRLDSTLKVAEEQFVAGGVTARVEILNSKAGTGSLTPSRLEIPGGTNTAVIQFQPSAEGDAMLSLSVPPGFAVPAEFASVTAIIRTPTLTPSTDLLIGRDLEVRGVVGLGAAAPDGGLKVTLTSDDPTKLLLSASATGSGSKSITLTVPAGVPLGLFYLQALENTGSVNYRASAAGYRDGQGTVTLAPSGIVLTPIFQGPPDEAQVLSKDPSDGTYKFSIVISKPYVMNLVAWTVQLDPVTHRSADITVQPLRGGLSLKIPLLNSNPSVGKIVGAVTIPGGSENSVTPFKALSVGSTEISVMTPKDFTVSANSTKVIALVQK